jgi:nucleoside-diphosphate-sugar epimerase
MPATNTKLICVTGGAGFIGSHTVGNLLELGHPVVVLDDFSTGKRENLAAWKDHPDLQIVETDVSDGLFAPLAPVVAERGPLHGIIHLAAQTSVIRSMEKPLTDARANYVSTVQVIEYARVEGVAKVVFTSSSAIYGDVAELPVTEAAPPAPMSPYGVHKRASELQLQYGSQVLGISTAALRLFNVYGPRQDPSSPYSGVISIFLERSKRGEDIVIFGDGGQTRDFVYVGDVARALTTACLKDGVNGLIANIGTGRAININELAAQCIACFGASVQVDHHPDRPGEIRDSVADISRAQKALGFEPQTSIEQGLQITADWVRNQG